MPTASKLTRTDLDDGRLPQILPDDLGSIVESNSASRRSARRDRPAPVRQGGVLTELNESMGQFR